MYDEYGSIVIPSGRGQISFGEVERREIAIALAVLVSAFTIVLTVSGYPLLYALLVSVVVSITGFLAHELGHKFVAQRYGAWAEFRTFRTGLIMALLFSFLGFLFAAPGAVYISGRVTKRQNGMISIAGPAVNIVMAALFLGLWALLPVTGWVSAVLLMAGYLNAFLGAFNLIPVPPLDGSKIIGWSPVAWVAAMAASVAMVLVGMGIITI